MIEQSVCDGTYLLCLTQELIHGGISSTSYLGEFDKFSISISDIKTDSLRSSTPSFSRS